MVAPSNLYRGIPYKLEFPDGGYAVEDIGLLARIPDQAVTYLARVYILSEDPFVMKVLSATSGKLYRLSPEAVHRAVWREL